MTRIRRHLGARKLQDVELEVRRQLAASSVTLPEGARVAVAVGSRGIANLASMVREVVRWVQSQRAIPFIVPAMGSHGGATAEGQAQVLRSYGVTESEVGAPVVSSMEVVELPKGSLPFPLYYDKHAAQAAATIVINRVKPHTSFHGHYESGLMKMIVVGLGKHKQAIEVHRLGTAGLREVMPQAARQSLLYNNVILGLAVVENECDETLLVRVLRSAEVPVQEPALLQLARSHMPALPLQDLDILIIDEIGKNVSGLGLDPNIVGRLKIRGEPEPASPRINVIIVRDLTPETHGNACGIGLADIATRRLFARIDLHATYENMLTTGFLERGKLPIIADSDRQALEFASRAAAMPPLLQARIIRIRNTLRLDDLLVSPRVVRQLTDRQDIEVLATNPMLDGSGVLPPF